MTSMLITLSIPTKCHELTHFLLLLAGLILKLALLAYQMSHIDTQLVKCVTYQAGEELLVRLFLLTKSEFRLFSQMARFHLTSHTNLWVD